MGIKIYFTGSVTDKINIFFVNKIKINIKHKITLKGRYQIKNKYPYEKYVINWCQLTQTSKFSNYFNQIIDMQIIGRRLS